MPPTAVMAASRWAACSVAPRRASRPEMFRPGSQPPHGLLPFPGSSAQHESGSATRSQIPNHSASANEHSHYPSLRPRRPRQGRTGGLRLPFRGEVQRIRQRPGALGSARRARALRRLTARRSSADSPPQTPSSWRDSMAQLRQGSTTSQRWQTVLASSIWESAGPVFPIGKNNSGSTPRQAARSRHVIRIGLVASKMGRAARESTQAANLLVISGL